MKIPVSPYDGQITFTIWNHGGTWGYASKIPRHKVRWHWKDEMAHKSNSQNEYQLERNKTKLKSTRKTSDKQGMEKWKLFSNHH